jgi:hypothetical protein
VTEHRCPRPLIALESVHLVRHGVDRAQQGETTAGHDAFRRRRLRGADRVLECLLSVLELGLGWRADLKRSWRAVVIYSSALGQRSSEQVSDARDRLSVRSRPGRVGPCLTS